MPRHGVFHCDVWRRTTDTKRKKCVLPYKNWGLRQITDGRSFQGLAPTHGLNRSVGRRVRKFGLPKKDVHVRIEALFPMFHLDGSDHIRWLPASFSRSVSGTLYTDTNCRWGPWARCIMANNAVNVFALSCRSIPIGARLNQWYTPRAKLLKTPLVKATGPACRLTRNKIFQGFTFFLPQFLQPLSHQANILEDSQQPLNLVHRECTIQHLYTSSRHIFHTHHLHILINNLLGGVVDTAGRRGGLGRWMRAPGGSDSNLGFGLLARHVP